MNLKLLFKHIRRLLILYGLLMFGYAQSEPVNRGVNAEFIAGYDFTVFHQQGDEVFFKFNDHSADFTSRSQNPAKFNFNIQSSREEINECSIHIITWRQQETEAENIQRVGAGISLDPTFQPGLAGIISSDKTIHTGDGEFKVAYSSVKADFLGPTKGDPFNPHIYDQILSLLLPYERVLNFAQLDDYPFQEYFTTVDPNKNLVWLSISGSWTDERYVVYTLPCKSIITLPVLDETAPTVSFSPANLEVVSAKSGVSSLEVGDNVGVKGSPEVQCTNGGNFSGSTFTAPTVSQNKTSICKATAKDAAGNIGSGTLKVSIATTTKPKPPVDDKWLVIGIIIAALSLLALGLVGLLLRKPKPPPKLSLPSRNSLRRERPSKPLERPDGVGVLFSGSPLLAANVAAPLSAAGQLTASSLQMLSGQFAALRPAYQATGRIGYAQEGKPSGEDYAFGTGFLVSPNHVITNRHVHGFYSEYLTGADCGGIEFIAEKDKDASDFYEFDGSPPVLVPGLDIAIYTLAKSVKNRVPIARIPLPTDGLEGREIVVVGYPDTFNPDDPELLKALEKDPVFAVKRISQGHIFRHSTDTDDPYGVQATVTENETTEFSMSAICHNASTMTGNSGSPILDAKTGELLGVHFAGYKIFNKKEAANLAMAIAYIVEQHDAHSPNLLSTKSHSKESTGLNTA